MARLITTRITANRIKLLSYLIISLALCALLLNVISKAAIDELAGSDTDRLQPDTADINRLQTDTAVIDYSRPSLNGIRTDTAIVLAKTRSEDISWLPPVCAELEITPFVYSTDKIRDERFLPARTDRGREAAAYLSYVVDNYHKLPKVSIFVHSDQSQWHNDLFGDLTANLLRNLRHEAVRARGYVNLRCTQDPGCPIAMNPRYPSEDDIKKNDIRAKLGEIFIDLFGITKDQVPEHVGSACCAQFAVSREQILKKPLKYYEHLIHWADTTMLTDSYGVGWLYEKIWHIVFSMDWTDCPSFDQCRCDTYGWCGPFPDGKVFQAIRAKDGK